MYISAELLIIVLWQKAVLLLAAEDYSYEYTDSHYGDGSSPTGLLPFFKIR